MSESRLVKKANLVEKLKDIPDYWNPRVVAELNGQMVKLAKLKGEFVWHHHENEDEMFFVVKGRFRKEFRDKHVWIGEFIVVPRGRGASTSGGGRDPCSLIRAGVYAEHRERPQ